MLPPNSPSQREVIVRQLPLPLPESFPTPPQLPLDTPVLPAQQIWKTLTSGQQVLVRQRLLQVVREVLDDRHPL